MIAGGVSALLLAFSMTPTFAALSAAIQNSVDTAGAGTLIMEEKLGTTTTCLSTDGNTVATNSATCSSINKYGGDLDMAPGKSKVVDITIKNAGSVPAASFSLQGGACAQSTNGTTNGGASDVCSKYNVVIKSGSTTIYTGTAAGFASQNLNIVQLLGNNPIAAGATVPFTFTVTLDANAGNAYQGMKISQPMTWTFGS